MGGNLVLLWLAAFPLMGSPGPATLSLAATGAAFGTRAGLGYLLGIISGTFVVLLLIATGITGVILAAPTLLTAVTIGAAAYILYLAFRIATAPPLSGQSGRRRPPSIVGGFLLAIANPKAFAAIGAVYSSRTVVDDSLAIDAIVKIAALLAVIVVVNTTWLFFGSAVSALFREPRVARAVNVTFAVLLVVSVALALIAM